MEPEYGILGGGVGGGSGSDDEDAAAAAYAAITSHLAQWGGGGGGGVPPTTPFGKTPSRSGGRNAVETPLRDGSPSDHPFGGGDFGSSASTPATRAASRMATPFGRTPAAGRSGDVQTPFPDGSPTAHPFYGTPASPSPYADDAHDEDEADEDMIEDDDDDDDDDEEGGRGDLGYYVPPARRAVHWSTPGGPFGNTPSSTARATPSSTTARTPSSTRAAPGSSARTTPGYGLFKTSAGVSTPSAAAATPGAKYGGAPVQTPAPGSTTLGSPTSPAVNAVRLAAAGGVATPAAAAAAEDAEAAGGATTEYDHSPLYDPNDNRDRPYLPYLSSLLSYLDGKAGLDRRIRLVEEEEDLGQDRTEERTELDRWGEQLELNLLSGWGEACRDRSARPDVSEDADDAGAAAGGGAGEKKFAAEECDLWSLLSALRTLGMDALLYSPSAAAGEEVNEYKRTLAERVEWDPAEVARALFEGAAPSGPTNNEEEEEELDPPLPLLRRASLLKWAESVHSRRLQDSPPSGVATPSRTTMWSDTLAALQRRRMGPNKVSSYHIDAPILDQFDGGPSDLFGQDDENDAKLLGECLKLMRAGDLEGAKELARGAGQGWRAAAWSGGEPYGAVKSAQDSSAADHGAMDGAMVLGLGEEKKSDDDPPSASGNPSRPLWQVATRTHGRNLAARSTSSTQSISLESAISALLSDDLSTSLSSVHHRSYLSSLHLYLRSLANRPLDETLHLHATNRRSVGRKYPFPATRHPQQELDHLAGTSSVADMTEGDAFARLERSEYAEVREEADGREMRRGLKGFGAGAEEARAFLEECAAMVLESDSAKEGAVDQDEDGSKVPGETEMDGLRRFLVHALLYLDDVAPDFADSVAVPVAVPSSPAAAVTATGPAGKTCAARDAVLHSYVLHLTSPSRRALWHVSTPYASLLRPPTLLVRVQSNFLARVNDASFRSAVLEQMDRHFDPGMELVCLRRAVYSVLDGSGGEWKGTDDGYPLMGLLGSASKSAGGRENARRAEDHVATEEDVRKMHATRWLLASSGKPSHRPDGIMCANALLRQFLLDAPPVAGKKSQDMGLNLARIYLKRFVPHDAARVALEYYSSEEYLNSVDRDDSEDEEGGGTDGDGSGGGNPHVPSPDAAEDAVSEFGALGAYVGARDAFQLWKRTVRRTSAVSPLAGKRRGGDGNVEDRIASKMERRSYLRRKAESGRRVAEVAAEARERLTEVLEYGGGWLTIDDADADAADLDLRNLDDPALAAEERAASLSRRHRRTEEARSLRSRCLPLSAFLLHAVLDGTGRWMERFEDDALAKFGTDGGRELLGGLLPDDDDDDDDDGVDMEGGDDGDDEAVKKKGRRRRRKETPLTPEYWHRAAVGAACSAGDDEAFGEDDRRSLLEAASESAVRLLVRTRG